MGGKLLNGERRQRRSLGTRISAWLSANRGLLTAYAIFIGFTVLAFFVVTTRWFVDSVGEPLNELSAHSSAAVMQLLGTEVVSNSSRLVSDRAAVDIKEGCNAVYAIIIFVAGIIAFPTSWKKRLLGALLGVVALLLINLVRIITLFYLSAANTKLFDEAHLYIWQFAIIIMGGLLWLVWYDKIVNRKSTRHV